MIRRVGRRGGEGGHPRRGGKSGASSTHIPLASQRSQSITIFINSPLPSEALVPSYCAFTVNHRAGRESSDKLDGCRSAFSSVSSVMLGIVLGSP